VQLVSKISNLCDPDPPTSQTDRQTDGRHAISIPRYALVHRTVKTQWESHNKPTLLYVLYYYVVSSCIHQIFLQLFHILYIC